MSWTSTMKTTSEVTACVIDHGIFLPVARRLAREYAKVYYWTPHEKAFPTVRDVIGDGFEDIERIDSPWSVVNETELFVFPDIGFAPMQEALIAQGKAVWGAGDGDKLEIYRGQFLHALGTTNLPLPNYTAIRGLTALKEHLRDLTDKWVKISRYRGDWETMHWRDWEHDETTLDAAAVRFGPWKEHITFYVFDPIDTELEDGYDGYCIDGQWPSLCIHGMESKDRAYLGTFQKMSELPQEIRVVNDAFGPILKEYGYRGFFSSEVRITPKGESYFIDPTCRAGSPPSQVMCEMIANLGEIVWHGANGELVDPVPAAKFGTQALLTVKGDRRNNWAVIDLPKDLEQWVKCGFASEVDGRLVIPPDPDNTGSDVGWVVAVGDTISEALNNLKSNVSKLPDGVCCDYSALADLLKEAQEAEIQGISMTDQPIPEPSTVLTDAN